MLLGIGPDLELMTTMELTWITYLGLPKPATSSSSGALPGPILAYLGHLVIFLSLACVCILEMIVGAMHNRG